MSEKPQYQFLTGFGRFVFYFVLTLSLFFGAAVLIFVLRGSSAEFNEMPDVTGKYYIDVHEDLSGRLQLRVRLEKRAFPDRAAGLVLSQSVAPGALVQPRDKIDLIVNQPDPLLKMPDLLRSSLQNAKAQVARVVGDERIYELTLGAVSEIETDEAPAGTVLAQFPPAGQNVAPRDIVYLLVAVQLGGAGAGVPASGASATGTPADLSAWTGQHISILGEYLNRRGIDYRLGEIKSAPGDAKNGQVFAVQPSGDGRPLRLGVYYTAPMERYQNGYELVEVSLDEPGACRAEQHGLSPTEAGELPAPRTIFATRQHGEDEDVSVLFYRVGESRIRFLCGDEVVYDRVFRPEYPG
jgi:beta-lactam-binding protein with PASTA domain